MSHPVYGTREELKIIYCEEDGYYYTNAGIRFKGKMREGTDYFSDVWAMERWEPTKEEEHGQDSDQEGGIRG